VGGARDEEALVSVGGELRRAGRIAGFGAVTATMLPAFVAHEALASIEDRSRVRDRWVSSWCSVLLRLFGVRVVAHGERGDSARGRLVVANHRSTADILVLLRAFGGRMVSRGDLARWPLIGPAARAAGTLFVDRSNAGSGAAAVRMIRTSLSRGDTVIVFPEGTTFPDDDVRRFQSGAFVAALGSGADVLPVGLAYATGSGAAFVNESFAAHLSRMAAARPSQVAMCVGAPIAPEAKARAATLRDHAQAEVQRLVRQARGMVDGRLDRAGTIE
jgi:lyso-ornithine lipid O-acyltransferase